MATVSEISEFRGINRIFLDGVAWLKIKKKHFAKCPLEVGDEIDPEAYADRLSALQAKDCYESALTLLDRAARTQGDMRRALVQRGYTPQAADAAVDRLAEIGLIDDARYARRIAETQLNKPVGIYALRRKLQAKQLSEEDVSAALEDFDDRQQAEACAKAAAALARKYLSLPTREARGKLSQALARRGFGWDAIREAVEQVFSDDDDMD